MTRKTVLCLIDRLESGGAERVLLRIIEDLNDFQIVLIPNFSGHSEFFISQTKDLKNLRILDSRINEDLSFIGKSKSLLQYLRFMYRFIQKEGKPDLAISFLERSNLVNILISKLFRLRSVISVRNNLSNQYASRSKLELFIVKLLIRNLYNQADCIVSLTKSVKSNLVKDFGVKESKIKVIYNSYDISTIQSKSKEVLNLDVSSFIKNKSRSI